MSTKLRKASIKFFIPVRMEQLDPTVMDLLKKLVFECFSKYFEKNKFQ